MTKFSKFIYRRIQLAAITCCFLLCISLLNAAQSPEWLQRDGIVMAGSWEPLLFRVRRDGAKNYTPTENQKRAYAYEQSQEMIDRLKDLGVNFVMTHCYKGGGLIAEKQSMLDAVKFAKALHDAQLHVGVYNFSGAFIWELFFKEMPQAKQWVLLNCEYQPLTYHSGSYRYYWNRNHPDAQAFYKNIIRFAVEHIKADLIHFDNYIQGPGNDLCSIQRFHSYLTDTFSSGELKSMGITDLANVKPPLKDSANSMMRYAWLDFQAQSLADSYKQMSHYASSLRDDILVECNPGSPKIRTRPQVDHGRLIKWGQAYWNEGVVPGYRKGKLHSRILSYKIARRMNNMLFAYTTSPLDMAESMAFNKDCLGCICWFEYGNIVKRPGSKAPMSKDLLPFIKFFHKRRDLLRNADVVADVAVLRSYPSQVFADSQFIDITDKLEQTLINNRVCFQIIYENHLEDMSQYRALALAGCVALSQKQIENIKRYVNSGGKLCIIGPVATYDQWMRPRNNEPFEDLPESNIVRINSDDDMFDAVRQACGNKLSVTLDAAPGLCIELTKQPTRLLLHLVNYNTKSKAKNIKIQVHLPKVGNVKSVTLASPERQKDLNIAFEQSDRILNFTVQEISIYEIAVIEIE